MGLILALVCLLVPSVFAQDKASEIDPNTKIQGGADVPGSAANAGADARSDNRMEPQTRVERREASRPDPVDKDKPLSARKPREPKPEDDAVRGETTRPGR